MKTALLFFFLFFITFAFAQEQDYTLKMTLGQTLNKPADFFITQDDNIFVADHFSYKLFNPDGKLIKEYFLDDSNAGRAVATDEQGNFYVIKDDEKVYKYAADGSLLMSFGSKGVAPGQLNGAQGIALDAAGNIYVADTDNNRIQKFDQNGLLLQVYNEVSKPSQIKIDADNKLNILNDNWFKRLHPDGASDIIITFIYSGNAGMALDKEGNIYLTNDYQVKKYNGNGRLIETYLNRGPEEGKIATSVTRLTFDSKGNLHLLENAGYADGNRIQIFTPQLDFISSFGNSGLHSRNKIQLTTKMKFDSVGNFYTTKETSENRISFFDKSGQFIRSFGGAGDKDFFYYPVYDFALDNQGDLYILANHEKGNVHRFSYKGEYISTMIQDSDLYDTPFPDFIFFDKSNHLYLVKDRVGLKYDLTGKLISKITFDTGMTDERGYVFPVQDVTIDAAGNFYMIQKSHVLKYDHTGKVTSLFYALNKGGSYNLTNKTSIALDDNGYIYVTDGLDIKKFDQSGNLVAFIQAQYKYPFVIASAELSVNPTGSTIRAAIANGYFFNNIRVYSNGEEAPLTNRISGTIFSDLNSNCTQDNEQGLEGIIVEVTPGPYYGKTDKTGFYTVEVKEQENKIKQILPVQSGKLIQQLCPASGEGYAVQFDAGKSAYTNINFSNKVTLSPYLSVSVSSDRRRRCFESITKLTYSNTGFAPAENAKVNLQLPEQVELLSADKPFTRMPNGTYVFEVGTVAPGQASVITIQDKVVCGDESIRGMTVCTKAWIAPGNQLPTAPPAAAISITGTCNPETGKVRFVIRNTGQTDMEEAEQFRKYIDGQLSTVEDFRLAAGDSMVLWVPTSGRTVRLEADQPDGNGDNTIASTTVEACTTVATRTAFSTGFVNTMPTDDEEAEVAEECLPIIDSFDPNDKLVTPTGRTEENYTLTGVALKYKIRFQNTGTDVAYRVVVVDTLSEHLDLSTLQIGSASHAYRYELGGKGRPVLTWTFDNIMLPDSTTNEPGSHGYIQFSIKPKADLPEKTAVENYADIFFDYNSPVRTNTTVNRIYDIPPVVNESVRMDLEQIIATPSINHFAPAAGKYGTEVTISGKKFSATEANNKVYFYDVPASVVSASETELRVLVPTGAATGVIKVTTLDGAASTADAFEVYQPPVLSSFSPEEGGIGSTVTLQGQHLNANLVQSVKLGSLTCDIISNTGHTLVVQVPEQAVTAAFEIITKGGETLSSSAYVVWRQPSISSLSKTTDIVDATISIYGEHFASAAERNIVRFGQAQAQVLQAKPGELTVEIPRGAASGFITVETPGGKAVSATHFELIPGPSFLAMAPSRGSVGTEVELTGLHFGVLGLQDEITFNGEKAQVLEASETRYKVRVPRGATTGKVKISGFGGIVLSTADFVVEELSPAQAIAVYPNPTTGHFTISFIHADFDVQAVQVYSTVGKLVHTATVASPRPEKLEVSLVQAGVYVLQIRTDRGIVIKKLNVL